MNKIELLAPGGDIDSIKAAIVAGADAIYCGLERFNARDRATNISFHDLNGILRLAHEHNSQVFLTLNIIILENEIPAFVVLLNKLVNTSIDGIILQDLGMFHLVSKYFKSLKLHASTQLTTHNKGQIAFLEKLSATRVNLSRELNIHEITELTETAHNHHIETEIFVHGSNCISYSGLCYMSSVLKGKSGNRGRCSQPCRDEYQTSERGSDFPLNLKDNCAYSHLKEISDASVDSIKIEGRIKKSHYVYTVVQSWRDQLEQLYSHQEIHDMDNRLFKVFNRDFTSSFLQGDINKDMFIDNPRDNSAIHLANVLGGTSEENIQQAKNELYDTKTEIIQSVERQITPLNIERSPLTLHFSGEIGSPLKVSVNTPHGSHTLFSKSSLKLSGAYTARMLENPSAVKRSKADDCLDYETLFKRFKPLNDTEYSIQEFGTEELPKGLFVPFKELTVLRREIFSLLSDSRKFIDPVTLPPSNQDTARQDKPTLSVLISKEEELNFCCETSAEIFFEIPNYIGDNYLQLYERFLTNENISPWFPSILIGENFSAATRLLDQLQPKKIITNNTGIAFEAYKRGIHWIAGPHLNITNSHSLNCLADNFDCSGAFISNEINKSQIKNIKNQNNLKLYYSIYHPILLMTSRQCLFHQVTGCDKQSNPIQCLQTCSKTASFRNMEDKPLFIEKSEGNCHCIYNSENFLNTEIINDLPGKFSSFFIDLRDIKTSTLMTFEKFELIETFERLLKGTSDLKATLQQSIKPTTNKQYISGL